MAPAKRKSARLDWVRRYPPLVSGAVAIVLAAFVLPSALNVPQTNPTQTVEYAPVPPTDEDQPPPAGNSSSLGLGSSGTVSGDGLGGDGPGADLPPAAMPGTGTVPRTKRCVGNPPRQTEDPLSPPCVAHFEGDNFGATHPGVSKKEIRVLFYLDPIAYIGDPDPIDQTFDLGLPATSDETGPTLPTLRAFQRYFNERFQTYDRFVHFWVKFTSVKGGAEATPEKRAADAAQAYSQIKPFAVLTSSLRYGNEEVFINGMVRKQVLSFGTRGGQPASFFRKAPGFIWSFPPTLDVQSQQFSSYVCDKIVGKPVAFSGNSDDGKPRRLALLSTREATETTRIAFAKAVKKQIQGCGGEFDAEATFASHGNFSNKPEDLNEAQQNVARFQQAGITTVVVAQGYETSYSKAAGQLRWYPEWVIAGDGLSDGAAGGFHQNQDVWRHARVVTPGAKIELDLAQQPCRRAHYEASPQATTEEQKLCDTTSYYDDLRQLFTGIQVAGPRLQPSTIDQGFHAIPAVESSDPRVPACFYGSGDYTCVKDAVAEYWDPEGDGPSTTPGCWRMAERGRRHLANRWPSGGATAQDSASDPCNGFAGVAPL